MTAHRRRKFLNAHLSEDPILKKEGQAIIRALGQMRLETGAEETVYIKPEEENIRAASIPHPPPTENERPGILRRIRRSSEARFAADPRRFSEVRTASDLRRLFDPEPRRLSDPKHTPQPRLDVLRRFSIPFKFK